MIRKCRYEDCKEHNPVAEEDEQVTCATCREYLGLPPLNEEDIDEDQEWLCK